MNKRNSTIFWLLLAFAIMSLQNCNNLSLLDQLENPGTTGKSGNNTVFLFATNNSFNGNIKGGYVTAREAGDDQCRLTRNTLTFPDNGCTRVRAVISTSAADSIANMQGNYFVPVDRTIHGPNNFVIAANWGNLIAGLSGNSLVSGNVMAPATSWWSFSTLGGNYDGTNNCSGGTVGTSVSGAIGDSSTSGNTWIATGTALLCSNSAKLLCLCY